MVPASAGVACCKVVPMSGSGINQRTGERDVLQVFTIHKPRT